MPRKKPFNKVVDQFRKEETVRPPANYMGIGKLGSPKVTFMRTFRWLLFSSRLPCWFVSTCKVDYVKKTLTMTCLDVLDDNEGLHGLFWAEELHSHPDEILTFITLDGCGYELSKTEFSELTLLEHETTTYDYSVSEVASRKIVVSFNKSKTVILPTQPKNDMWKQKKVRREKQR